MGRQARLQSPRPQGTERAVHGAAPGTIRSGVPNRLSNPECFDRELRSAAALHGATMACSGNDHPERLLPNLLSKSQML